MSTAAYVFYDVYMGWSHASLLDVMRESVKKDTLERGEVAVFINKAWTAVKILGPGNVMLYHRTGSNKNVAIETIRYLPTVFGGHRLAFAKNLEAHVIKAYETKFGKQMNRLRVEHA